jgi:hypothetical protein
MEAIQLEIMEEKAAALARAERRLLDALGTYRAQGEGEGARREDAAWTLVDAVTCFVVQREACGLRDAYHLFELYGVPKPIVARIGARPLRA